MVVVGKPGEGAGLRGTYECTCARRERISLFKGELFPIHTASEVWLWGFWPWKPVKSAPALREEFKIDRAAEKPQKYSSAPKRLRGPLD